MNRTIIIAEAGVNHNGELPMALDLVSAAAEAGADYIKFQTFIANKLVTSSAKKAKYQLNPSDESETQLSMLQKLELTHEDHLAIIDHCNKCGIKFLSTAFDPISSDFLHSLDLDLIKIPSGELTNLPFLISCAKQRKMTLLSTGMADLQEIRDALKILLNEGLSIDDIVILHCNTDYPTAFEDANLLAINHLRNEFNCKVGFSDHTLGVEAPLAAVSLGASVIEKHFTLDRNLQGPDHAASIEPKDLKILIQFIRNVEVALGDGIKKPTSSEYLNRSVVRKSIHLSKPLVRGDIIRESDLIMKRPGDGISPMKMFEVIGKKIQYDLPVDHKLSLADLL